MARVSDGSSVGFGSRLVDQHDRDIIADRIYESTFRVYTFQSAVVRLQLDLRFAFRTTKDLQQFVTYRHMNKSNAEPGNRRTQNKKA